MFKTTERSAMFSKPMGSEGVQFWAHVEHDIQWPWFYLQIVQKYGEEAFRTMIMLSSAQDVADIVMARTAAVWIEEAYLATPGNMNGSSHWKMEPLRQVDLIRNVSNSVVGARFGLESGEVYFLGESSHSSDAFLHRCFCADSHLGPKFC